MKPPSSTQKADAPDAASNATSPPTAAAQLGDRACCPPAVVLGADHPLTRAVHALESLGRQALAVAAILLGSIAGIIGGVAWATPSAVSAVIVLLGLGVAAAALTQRRRDHALGLILAGRDEIPITAVQKERQRLSSTRTQRQLANAIDHMVAYALKPPTLCTRGARPLYTITVVASVADDLQRISQPLRVGRASVRGVALAERLLTDGGSPLYGNEAAVLRDELQRIHCVISG